MSRKKYPYRDHAALTRKWGQHENNELLVAIYLADRAEWNYKLENASIQTVREVAEGNIKAIDNLLRDPKFSKAVNLPSQYKVAA